MNLLARTFRRTPSLRTRVAFASAVAAAILITIVGTIVWVGITNDRKERLDRRLDEAAGFAIPFLPRGLEQIPKSPNDQDAIITVRKDGRVSSNSDVILPELPAGYDLTNPLGPVVHRYRTFFDVFGSFDNYVTFWMLEDLVTDEPGGPQVRFLMPRDESGPYDFQRESGLPRTADAYSEYLIAADDFVQARNRRLAAHAATITRLADPICQACLATSDGVHQRWTL